MLQEDLNLVGDCLETVYNQVDPQKQTVVLESLKKLVDNKTKPDDFSLLKNIAKGGYGEVFLVKRDKVYAMKRVSKELVLNQPHTALYMAEKSVLVDSIGSQWLVSAEMTLQDSEYLYYLMDFIPGGDFMGLLAKEDVLEESWVRFYVSEILAALEELHNLGWIHRDLKPDNILIGLDGHIKLADFGSCIKMENGKARSSITVGTPDYLSPDILTSSSKENEYSEKLDFWTLGVIIYEMLYGVTPFYSNTLVETYRKITEIDFIFPFKVGDTLKDLIQRLICREEVRLDINGIKSHPFFAGVDWTSLKKVTPPFVPEISGESDTSHFVDSDFEIEKKGEKGVFLPFVGFTFDPALVESLQGVFSKGGKEEDAKFTDSTKTNEEDAKFTDSTKTKEEIERLLNSMQIEHCELSKIQNEIERKTDTLESIVKELERQKGNKKEVITFKGQKNETGLDKLVLDCVRDFEECRGLVGGLGVDVNNLLNEHATLLKDTRRTNCGIQEKLKALELENSRMKKIGVDSLKKQVRILTTEIKEYEQKLEQEALIRKNLEDELKSIKGKAKTERGVPVKFECSCRVVEGDQLVSTAIKIDDEYFCLGSVSHQLGNVFLQELKNNELHHQSYKTRSLALKVIFIKESIKSVSSAGRRNIKSLEEDLRVEESMIKGLEAMMGVLSGRPLEEARLQMKGSQRKIVQLKQEIEMARKSTLTEEVPEDPVKLYEFNNHLYAVKTFPQGVLCEHCNEVLYGIKDQGFECRDCKMVVHRSCYVLGDVSCEMYSAFKRGESFYVVMRSIEEKEKLLAVYKHF